MVSGVLNSRRIAAFISSASMERGSFDSERLEVVPDCRLRLRPAQEKFDRVAHSLRVLGGAREGPRPLPDDSVENPLHELGEMNDRKIAGHFAVFLAFGDDFA